MLVPGELPCAASVTVIYSDSHVGHSLEQKTRDDFTQQEPAPVCLQQVVPIRIRTKGWATMDRTPRHVCASSDLSSQLPRSAPQRRGGKSGAYACEPLPISGTRIDLKLFVKTLMEERRMHQQSHHMIQVRYTSGHICSTVPCWRQAKTIHTRLLQALPTRYRNLLAGSDVMHMPSLQFSMDDVDAMFALEECVE